MKVMFWWAVGISASFRAMFSNAQCSGGSQLYSIRFLKV